MAAPTTSAPSTSTWGGRSLYADWMQAQGVPIYRGHAVDLPDIELAPWSDHECNAAFLWFEGMQDVHEARVIEIAPGKTLPPSRLALEELVYVVGGRGICTVWGAEGLPKKSFEWGSRAIFIIPPNYTYQLSNTAGNQPARVMISNYLPLAVLSQPSLDFFFNNPYVDLGIMYGEDQSPFAEAVVTHPTGNRSGLRNLWVGNFLPDMGAWDKLEPYRTRGAGGSTVYFRSKTGKGGHMSVFPPARYKMAHRHGPGRVIVIPRGEGYTIVNPPGGEKEILPWKEGTVFTPPEQWYHQHFNVGTEPARYIAFGPPRVLSGHWEEYFSDQQISYTKEDPWIREKFEEELAKRGMKSDIPEQAYTDPNYEWDYGPDGD
jgi:oxalate decarboxylase/phosphoglucose isomerase-like protein (cupin superfamily)